MPTLKNMKTEGFNGTPCVLIACKSPGRVGARLPDGRTVAVRLDCIEDETTPTTCPVCIDPLFKPITTTLVCGHALHWYCRDEWQKTARFNHEAEGARCPVCRAYVGQPIKGHSALQQDTRLLVFQALGAIHQNVARLDGRPEPSFDEEMAAIVEQMQRAKEQDPNCMDQLDVLRRHFLSTRTDESQMLLFKALTVTLITHCVPCGAEHTVSPNYTSAIEQWLGTLIRK